ncbi:MAG: GspH/FimT family pseudopilin [Gammaproteobacteria bacterium]
MQKHSGFTIVELLVTMAVFGVLAAIAFPQMAGFSDNNRLVSQVNNLSANLQYARSEAIRRVRNVTIETLDGTANWHNGWQVYVDTDNSGTAGANELLRVVAALGANSSFVAAGVIPNQVIFTPNGRSNVAVNVGEIFKLCQTNRPAGNFGKTLTLFPIGRLTVTPQTACP